MFTWRSTLLSVVAIAMGIVSWLEKEEYITWRSNINDNTGYRKPGKFLFLTHKEKHMKSVFLRTSGSGHHAAADKAATALRTPHSLTNSGGDDLCNTLTVPAFNSTIDAFYTHSSTTAWRKLLPPREGRLDQ